VVSLGAWSQAKLRKISESTRNDTLELDSTTALRCTSQLLIGMSSDSSVACHLTQSDIDELMAFDCHCPSYSSSTQRAERLENSTGWRASLLVVSVHTHAMLTFFFVFLCSSSRSIRGLDIATCVGFLF
jgi:hypothetical protein